MIRAPSRNDACVHYPSKSQCNSSGAKQQEFVEGLFAAWDRHTDQIQIVTFVWLSDLSPVSVAGYGKYYGISDAAFLDYLGTLEGTSLFRLPAGSSSVTHNMSECGERRCLGYKAVNVTVMTLSQTGDRLRPELAHPFLMASAMSSRCAGVRTVTVSPPCLIRDVAITRALAGSTQSRRQPPAGNSIVSSSE